MAIPLTNAVPLNSSVFMVTQYTKRYMETNHSDCISKTNKALIAGGVGGFYSLIFFVPGDLLKCRAQMTSGKLDYRREINTVMRE